MQHPRNRCARSASGWVAEMQGIGLHPSRRTRVWNALPCLGEGISKGLDLFTNFLLAAFLSWPTSRSIDAGGGES